jgi:hypothetical protein
MTIVSGVGVEDDAQLPKEIIGSGTRIGAAVADRLVRDQMMRARRDLLYESDAGAADGDFGFVRCFVDRHSGRLRVDVLSRDETALPGCDAAPGSVRPKARSVIDETLRC